MRLTKTQQRLLDSARQHGGSYSVESGTGRGPQGGRIKYGDRDMNALRGLEAAGLVSVVHRQSGNIPMGNGATVFSVYLAYRLVTQEAA